MPSPEDMFILEEILKKYILGEFIKEWRSFRWITALMYNMGLYTLSFLEQYFPTIVFLLSSNKSYLYTTCLYSDTQSDLHAGLSSGLKRTVKIIWSKFLSNHYAVFFVIESYYGYLKSGW